MKVMTEFCGELLSREMSSAKNRQQRAVKANYRVKKQEGAFAAKSHH